MATLKFEAVIEIIGVNPYVLVNHDQAEQLKPGWRKPMPVIIQVNGQPQKPWHINMMPKGDGNFYLYLAGPVREASQTKVGDRVTVEVSFDDTYKNGPLHPMPKWFKDALNQNPVAKANWEKLIPSRQKEILRYFAGLKSQEAIDRNLERALKVLSGSSERFMARSWNKGK